MEKKETISIGELARRAGCKTVTVRYYERLGLVADPKRTPGGHRCYEDTHLQRLTFIIRCRQLGFPLTQVRELLNLSDSGQTACNDVRGIAQRHLREVREKIAELEQLEARLTTLTGQCDAGTTQRCPIIESLSH